MKVDFSKDFTKALDKLCGKIHHSIVEAINDVIDAQTIEEISNCRKIETRGSRHREVIFEGNENFVVSF